MNGDVGLTRIEPQQNAVSVSLINGSYIQVVHTLFPYGGPPRPRSRVDVARAVFEGGRTAVGGFWVGRASGIPQYSIEIPIQRGERVVYDLAMSMPVSRLQDLLLSQRLPPDGIGAIAEYGGRILARTPNPGLWVGKMATPDVLARITTVNEGWVDFRSFEGIPMTGAFSHDGLAHWVVVVSVPSRALIRDALFGLWPVLAGALIATIAALTLAILLGRRIIVPVRSLVAPALALGEGRAVEGIRFGLIEADEVGRALETASALLHARAQERDRAEAALRESERRSTMAQEGAHVGIWEWDVPSDRMIGSPECSRLYGVTPGTLNSIDKWRERVHPDDRAGLKTLWRGAMARNESCEVEFRILHESGEIRWLMSKGRASRDAAGEIVKIVGVNIDITERKRAQLELERERGLLRTLVDTIPDLIWLKDADGVYLFGNPAYERLLGCREAEIVGTTDDDFYPPDLAERFRAFDRRTIEAGQPSFNQEWVTVAGSDRRLLVESIKAPVRDKGGTLVGILGIGRDITARYEAEMALRESESRFRAYVEASPLAILVVDGRGRYADANPAAVAMLGYDLPTITSMQVPDIVPAEDRETALAAFQTVVRGDRLRGDFRLKAADGAILWVNAVAVRISDDRFLAFCQDITDRKAVETELAEHREHLEQLVQTRTAELQQTNDKLLDIQFAMDSVGIAIHWVDIETGRLLYVNRFAAEFLGYSVDEMLRMTVFDIDKNISIEKFEDVKELCLRQPRTALESSQTTKDGRVIPVEVVLNYRHADANLPARFVAFITDISQRKAAEAAREKALEEAERLARLRRDFLANMSHEIRTPLNAVLGIAQIGAKENREGNTHDQFRRILEGGQGLLCVVDDILDFSKMESGRLTVDTLPFVLGDVIDRSLQAVALRAFAKGLHLSVEEAPGLPASCLGDPKRIQQILVNLLGNAVKFTDGGGTVALSVTEDGGQLLFRISDTGIGMAPETIERLFRPFEQADGSTTRKFGGTGLGLAISFNLVGMMGGTISASGAPGNGSVFEVRLPLVRHGPAAPPPEGVLALFGLPAGETAAITGAIPDCRVIEALERAPEEATMLVVDAAAAAEPWPMARIGAWLAGGRRVAVVTTPGYSEVPLPLWGKAAVLERPLRLRHLSAALSEPAGRKTTTAFGERLAGMTVMMAEDNAVNRMVLKDMLKGEGARVLCFENGRLAAEYFRRGDAETPDLIVTDIQMPEMDGYELARTVRSLAPGLPVIGLTAHAMTEERIRCDEAGMLECLIKPVDLDVLVATILRHSTPKPKGATAPSAPERQTLDFDDLETHYRDRTEFLRRLMATVVSSHRDTADTLRQAAASGDFERMRTLSHAVKGTAANVKARSVHQLASQTECAARAGDAEARDLAEKLADQFDALMTALRDYLDGSPSAPAGRASPTP